MRIVGGVASGRRLQAPSAGTRPTSDRVREAQFSALGSLLGTWEGAQVLDLYAGSGALGLEALSRGATRVTLVEKDRRASQVMGANVAAVGLPGAQVVTSDVTAYIARGPSGTPYDVVLADPPYAVATRDVRAIMAQLASREWTSDAAVAVIERSARDDDSPWPDEGWEPLRRRHYGDTALWYGRITGRESP